jgi:hypothetical protein
VPFFADDLAMARFWRLNWQQLQDGIVATGPNEADFAQTIAELADLRGWLVGPAMIAAWGQRPPA